MRPNLRGSAALIAIAVLAPAVSTHALPVSLELIEGADGSFVFPRVHNANQAPLSLDTDRGPATFFRKGVGPSVRVIEEFRADVGETSIQFLGGSLRLGDGTALPDFVVTGGSISFVGVGENEYAGTLETSAYGTFFVLNRRWIPEATQYPPNSFRPPSDPAGEDGEGGVLALWANNWDRGEGPTEGAPWGLDLVFRFDGAGGPEPPLIIPEPGSGLLLGLAIAGFGIWRTGRPGR